jgi:hypothetical protein
MLADVGDASILGTDELGRLVEPPISSTGIAAVPKESRGVRQRFWFLRVFEKGENVSYY